MAKKSRASSRNERAGRATPRPSPNWTLLAISAVGVVLTSYLTITALSGESVRGCSAGNGCDVVLTSRWATTLGAPTAFWGLLAYASLAATAFLGRSRSQWRYAWSAAFVGVAVSVYLTTVSVLVLNATCPYCLTSLTLMGAALALTTYQRPSDLSRSFWRQWLVRRAALAAGVVLAFHLAHRTPAASADSLFAEQLAEHLTRSGAKFYGASWCGHCQDQKTLFGTAASRLPFIECKPAGPSGSMTRLCLENRIERFPTWVIKGQRFGGVLTLPDLASKSGFQVPAATH